MRWYIARLERLDLVIVLLLRGLWFACAGGVLACVGTALLVCWQNGFTGKWRLAVLLYLAFAACFYWQMFQVRRLAQTLHRLLSASALSDEDLNR